MIIKTDKESINKLKALKKEKEEKVKNGLYDEALNICEKISKLESKEQENKTSNEEITKNDILKVIENKSNIPMFLNYEEILTKVSNILEEKIYSEEKAKKQIINNLNIYFKKDKNLKLLLLGPSGVGKTSSVKHLSETLKMNLIRLDMSEYNLETSVNKLIGVSHGYVGYDDDYIFNKVKYNPYSVILVDEIEKSHPSVLNLFLQIMDEGFITDAHGEKIDFSHTLIFMTSNAIKNKTVGFGSLDKSNLNENFSEEFLGRFDDIIYFEAFTKEEVLKYLQEKINDEKTDYDKILEEMNYTKYGFRNINKIIDKYTIKIEN